MLINQPELTVFYCTRGSQGLCLGMIPSLEPVSFGAEGQGVIPYRNHLEIVVQEELHLHEWTSGVLERHYWSQSKKHLDFLSQFGHG